MAARASLPGSPAEENGSLELEGVRWHGGRGDLSCCISQLERRTLQP